MSDKKKELETSLTQEELAVFEAALEELSPAELMVLDALMKTHPMEEALELLWDSENDEENIPEYYFSNPDPYWKPEPLPPDHPHRNIRFDDDGNIHVKNIFAFWLPEFTLQKEIGGTIYTVTGSYDGTETLDKKMERIMGEKFTEKQEVSE